LVLPSQPFQRASGDSPPSGDGRRGDRTADGAPLKTYDAYGSVLSADALQAFPPVHAGYKGLFADRLDVPVAETSTTGTAIIGEPPRCVPFAAVLYQNRNRTYAPGLGRFMQQDPNATAMVLMESAAYHGRGIGAVVAAFSAEQMYGDGGNLYGYLGSNPWDRSDPMGLAYDPFDMVDDYLIESISQQIAFGEAARGYWTQVGITALSLVPIVGSVIAGNEIGQRLARGEDLQALDYVTIGAHFLPLGGAIAQVGSYAAARLIQRTENALARLRFRYAQRGARGSGLVAEEFNSLRVSGNASGCFRCMAGETEVWTPGGAVLLKAVSVGQLVMTAGDGAIDPVTGDHGNYGPEDVTQLWAELGKGPYRPVHLRVERPDGSTTEIVELVLASDVADFSLERCVRNQVKVWIDDLGERKDTGSPASLDGRGGWANVLSVGDIVRLGDGIDLPTATAAPVLATFVTTKAKVLVVKIDGWIEPLVLTSTHPMWRLDSTELDKPVPGGRWVVAGALVAGDRVRTSTGQACVESVVAANESETVYNLTVAGGHTFFVGQGKAWVHNMKCRVVSIDQYAAANGYTKKEVLYAMERLKNGFRGTHPIRANPNMELLSNGGVRFKGNPDILDTLDNWGLPPGGRGRRWR